MTTAPETTDNDFEQMMQMLTGFFVTQIAGAVATYSIGRERTLAEFSGLLQDAGLRFSQSTPIRPPIAVIEAVAA